MAVTQTARKYSLGAKIIEDCWYSPAVVIRCIIVIAGVVSVAAAGNHFTAAGMPWYFTQRLPSFAPPGWLIGLVWMTIYALSVISLCLYFRLTSSAARQTALPVIALAVVNGILNALWCYLFFYLHQPGAAVVEMLLLEATVLALIVVLWPASRLCAALFMPYAVWVGFATIIAWSFWQLNRSS